MNAAPRPSRDRKEAVYEGSFALTRLGHYVSGADGCVQHVARPPRTRTNIGPPSSQSGATSSRASSLFRRSPIRVIRPAFLDLAQPFFDHGQLVCAALLFKNRSDCRAFLWVIRLGQQAPADVPLVSDGSQSKRSTIVEPKRKPKVSIFGPVPDNDPEEQQRRGDAADALWRELVGQARAGGDDA